MRYYSHTVLLFYILQTILFRYAEILKNGSLRYPVESEILLLCFSIVFQREISYFRSHHLTEKREARQKPNLSLFLQKTIVHKNFFRYLWPVVVFHFAKFTHKKYQI